jgi:putative hemolysin
VTKHISEILREMQSGGERMAIVTDEYGGTEGLITMEDILEEIIGDIKSDNKLEPKEFSELPDGSFSILGSMEISDFNDTFNISLPESDDYNTVAGFAADISGKILNRGEFAEYEEIKFELIKKIRQKMVQFKVYSMNTEISFELRAKQEN